MARRSMDNMTVREEHTIGEAVPKMGTTVPILGTELEMGSLAEALFGRTRRAILGLLFSHPDESFYLRQIARLLGLGHGALQRELRGLTAAGILVRERSGQQTLYRVNRSCPIYNDLSNLIAKTVGLADVLRAALAALGERIDLAFVYGSLAKGVPNAASDVDVMVIGSASFSEIVAALSPLQDTLRREINPSVYPPAEFRRKVQDKSHFLTTVLGEPKIMLIGEENELERLAKAGVAD